MNKSFLTAATVLLVSTATAQAGGTGEGTVNTGLASQPRAFVTQSSVKPRLKKLMGLVNARFLQKNFGTVSTLQSVGGVVAVTGCRPHDCAANSALVVYDIKHDAFKVWLTVNDKNHIFTEKGFAAPLNKDAHQYIKNFE